MVQEFYLALKQREATRPFYDMRSFVKVRGDNIPVTEMSTFQFYDAPYYYRGYLYKTNLKEFKNIYRINIKIFNERERDVDISNRNNNT
ncbi:hypothetical protein Gotri_000670 [Gossypium trilobum]|nr:hypothetical protein [Gossypium trilobum]